MISAHLLAAGRWSPAWLPLILVLSATKVALGCGSAPSGAGPIIRTGRRVFGLADTFDGDESQAGSKGMSA